MMAELNCFITNAEFIGLLQGALADGYVIHSKRHLSSPMPAICHSAEEVASAVSGGQHAFILERPEVCRYPIELVPVEGNGSRFWYARSKEGGPVIEAHYFAPFEKVGRRVVPCSLVAYHTRIINPRTGQLEAAGEPIKVAFSLLLAPLRKTSRRVKSAKQSAIVSPGVDALISSGWSLAPPFGP